MFLNRSGDTINCLYSATDCREISSTSLFKRLISLSSSKVHVVESSLIRRRVSISLNMMYFCSIMVSWMERFRALWQRGMFDRLDIEW